MTLNAELDRQGEVDRQHLLGLNAAYVLAVQKSDAAWFASHLAADFKNGNPDGSLSSREAFLAQVARPCPVRELRASDVDIRLHGDTAVIRAMTTFVSPDGHPGTGRYTDIWVRSHGQWLCVSADVRRS